MCQQSRDLWDHLSCSGTRGDPSQVGIHASKHFRSGYWRSVFLLIDSVKCSALYLSNHISVAKPSPLVSGLSHRTLEGTIIIKIRITTTSSSTTTSTTTSTEVAGARVTEATTR